MEKIIHTMMDLMAYEVCGEDIDKSQYTLTDEEFAKLYKLSKSHDLAHLVGDALIKNNLIGDGEIKAKFQKQIMLAVYRYEALFFNCPFFTDLCRPTFNPISILFQTCFASNFCPTILPCPTKSTKCYKMMKCRKPHNKAICGTL